ncbi:MAG TPA: alpha/beta hydrolase [Burkholderiaceae bacterium]|nr:alpha/beta hydrolase [Burkholderiaceae bacterium]
MKYTQDFCDREYNIRAHVPEYPAIFSRWAAQGAATRSVHACLLDLAYGDEPAERLDIFPAREEPSPLLIFIHGGYWRSMDKSDFSWIAPNFVRQGVSVALINYGLAPRTPIEDMVRQTLAAIAWLYRKADHYEIDRDRISLCGHSAGAHLAAMSMAALWNVFGEDLPADLVKGALAISGVYDLEPLVHASFLNVDLKLNRERAVRLSPVSYPARAGARLITAVGSAESSEFARQTALIGQHWGASRVRDVPLPGCNHYEAIEALPDPAGPLFDAALDLVRR